MTALSALKQELLAYRRDVEDLATFQDRQAYNFSVAAENLDADGPPQGPEAFEFALVSIAYGRSPPSTSGTLQELVASGRLSTLSDPALRRELAAHLTEVETLRQQNLSRVAGGLVVIVRLFPGSRRHVQSQRKSSGPIG